MNVNLLRRIFQNSKKCNKLIYNVLITDGVSTANTVRVTTNPWRPPQRCFSSDQPPASTSQKLPPLMDFPIMVWPSLFKSLKNLILTTFIIKPYFDMEFQLPDFIKGSKKAAEVISHRLAEGEDLEGLVSSDIIPALKDKVGTMSLSQRELIPINAGDVYFAFPYQIGVIFNQDQPTDVQKRFVEITMVYHVLRGLSAMRSQGEEPPLNMGMLPEYQEKISICNYRFIKEFTKGVESDWTVNLLNHFRPVDDEKD